jgi:hypothetical protein
VSLAALSIVAVSATASAQGTKQFGALAGVDFATMTGTDFNNTGSKTGFIGGFYASIGTGNASLAFEPELLYANKGATDNNSTTKLGNNYLEIPVLVKYSFKPAGGVYLLLGPAVGFSLSCHVYDSSTSVNCNNDTIGLKPNTTFGGIIGLGFQKQRLGLEGRYDFDFGNTFQNVNGKNSVWEILVRFGFNK